MLGINQGPLGILAKRLTDKSVAVSVINRGSRGQDVTVKARNIGLLDTSKLARNLWTQEDIASFKTELVQRVQPHETVLLNISSR